MPSVDTVSRTRIADTAFALNLDLTHVIDIDAPSGICHRLTHRLPSHIGVHVLSNLTISISGTIFHKPVSACDLFNSAALRHLHAYLNKNAAQLGINFVSDVYAADEQRSGRPEFTISCSRALPDESVSRVRLRSIHFAYNWIPKEDSPSYADIFSQQLFLPFQSALDNAVGKAVTNHLVARYPMIFGPWCKRFDGERSLFPSIARSIEAIQSHSPNATFRKKCKGLQKQLRVHAEHDENWAIVALNDLVPMLNNDDTTSHTNSTKHTVLEDSFCLSLERIFRTGVRPVRFKASSTGYAPRHDETGQDAFDLNLSLASAIASPSALDLAWDDIFFTDQPELDNDASDSSQIFEPFLDLDDFWTLDDENTEDGADSGDLLELNMEDTWLRTPLEIKREQAARSREDNGQIIPSSPTVIASVDGDKDWPLGFEPSGSVQDDEWPTDFEDEAFYLHFDELPVTLVGTTNAPEPSEDMEIGLWSDDEELEDDLVGAWRKDSARCQCELGSGVRTL